jgi:hypothetical protein
LAFFHNNRRINQDTGGKYNMLLYFILGSLFTEIVLPFITSLTEVLMTLMETIKGKLSVKIS